MSTSNILNSTPRFREWAEVMDCSKCAQVLCICPSTSGRCPKCYSQNELVCRCSERGPSELDDTRLWSPSLEDIKLEELFNSSTEPELAPASPSSANGDECGYFEIGVEKEKKKSGVRRQLFPPEKPATRQEIQSVNIVLQHINTSSNIAIPVSQHYAIKMKADCVVLGGKTSQVTSNLRIVQYDETTASVRVEALTNEYWLGKHISDVIGIKTGIVSPRFRGDLTIDILNKTTDEIHLPAGIRIGTLKIEEYVLDDLSNTFV